MATLRSGRTSFDQFRDALQRGDQQRAGRYPVAAQRGLRLFIGRAICSLCHAGPLFSKREFGDIGAMFFPRPGVVDPGRHGGIAALLASPFNLLGVYADATTSGQDDPGPFCMTASCPRWARYRTTTPSSARTACMPMVNKS